MKKNLSSPKKTNENKASIYKAEKHIQQYIS